MKNSMELKEIRAYIRRIENKVEMIADRIEDREKIVHHL
jgi:hypothetical protein